MIYHWVNIYSVAPVLGWTSPGQISPVRREDHISIEPKPARSSDSSQNLRPHTAISQSKHDERTSIRIVSKFCKVEI